MQGKDSVAVVTVAQRLEEKMEIEGFQVFSDIPEEPVEWLWEGYIPLGEITQRFHKKTTGGNNSTATHVSDLDPNRINHFAGGVMALGSGVQSSAGRVRGGGGRGNRQDGSGVSEADANNSALASFRVLRTGT